MRHQASNPTAEILRLVTKNLTELVMAYDMDRRLVFVNPAVETLTGYSMEELEKANFICWIHPDDQVRMLKLWDQLFQGRPFHDEEYRLIAKDGRVKWVAASWTPIVDDTGTQVGVQGRDLDLTARKLTETALRLSEEKLRADEERYRTLFENSPFPMWEEDFSDLRRYLDSLAADGVSDIRGYLAERPDAVEECVRRVRILDVNRAARDFYGAQSKEELLGSLGALLDEQALEVFRNEIATLAENHSSFHVEFQAKTLKNEERLVDMIVSIVASARRDWSRVIVTFFDITDRKRLEEQYFQSQKMESLGRLAGGVAHDFNNFLTVINGYCDWMLGEMAFDNPFRERLAAIHKAGLQCADLTRQLLAFGRKQIVQPAPLNLNHVIAESRRMLDRVLGDDIEISTRLAEDLGAIEADRSQMHQVLMNLVVNAREAMPAGGSLTIETRNLEESREVLLEIRDTGQGMDETTRRQLFEPFFTTKKGTKPGLGLSIVFGIVSLAGGRIEVQSRPDEGAAILVFLPRSDSPVREAPEPPRPRLEPPRPNGGDVLVVEDRPDVRALTCSMLQALGYRAFEAANGAEAMAVAEKYNHAIPLLLTDVVMPGMNGREVAERLCELQPGMKVIYMSGFTDHILTETGKLDGSTLYLQKPFTLAQLAERLREADAHT